MSHRYNFRHQRNSPNYRVPEEEEEEEVEEESDEEETGSPHGPQDRNTSHRSASEDSHLDYSDNASGLSSTASESFSYHSGLSPTARPAGNKMYPNISSLNQSQDRSPSPRRRNKPKPECLLRSSPEDSSSHRATGRSQPPPSATPRNQPRENTYFGIPESYWLSFGAIICIVFLLLMLIGNRDSPSDSPVDSEDKDTDFVGFCKKVDSLRKRFPGQTQRFWKVVKSCTKHIFDPEQATYPAILLMVGEKKHAALASHIAEAIRQEFESIRLKSSLAKESSVNLTTSAGEMNVDKQKLFLDEWLRERLDNNQVAVVVNHLESLLPESALLLHGYCDGDNAPYKEAMLIFSLFLDQAANSTQAAEDALRTLWTTEFMRDKIGALLSRVANNIVLVNGPSD